MTLDDTIRAHVAWKIKLQSYLAGHGEKLDATRVSQDCHCDLGKWIHGEGGARHGALSEFRTLKADHAAFHQSAGRVVSAHDRGDKAGARMLLDGEFSERSGRVVLAITAIKRAGLMAA